MQREYGVNTVYIRTRVAVAGVAALGMALTGTAAGGATPDWHKVPHSTTEATLMDVAPVSGNDAWSVGMRQVPQDTAYPLAEHWDGTAWTEVPVPATPTGAGELDGVSAVSAKDVWAVGDSSGQGPVLRHWNGTEWTVSAPALPPGGAHPGSDRLYDVAAVAPAQAWAVGRFSGSTPQTLVERWDGQTWSRVPTPSPGPWDNTLQGVSALSATNVWAVGWYAVDQGNVALALHWDGRTWTKSPMTPPPGNTELQDVTAVSATSVWAVGDNEGKPLLLHWDGTTWHVIPRPSGPQTWLQTVADDGSGGVWVGGYTMTDGGTVSRPVFMHWKGSRWSTGTSEEPEGAVQGLARVGSSIWAMGTTSPCSCFVAPPLVEVYGAIPH
jgi:hypothetical protein